MNEQGIGFGNLSVRKENTSQFYISGSATGIYRQAEARHYALVTAYSFRRNSLTCQGPVRASSESLSHAAIYEADESIHSVIHVHHGEMWEYGMNRFPATDPSCSFGTSEIARNISLLLQNDKVRDRGILIMGGHPEGVLFFGHSPDQAGNRVLEYMDQVGNH
ncbi:MAG: class II aldolase/adducin family protein [bacterium]